MLEITETKRFVTAAVGEDVRFIKLPGTDPNQTDGGKSFEANLHGQKGEWTMGMNAQVLTSHFNTETKKVQKNERNAMGTWEGFGGRAITKDLSYKTSALVYGQVDVSYTDVTATPKMQNKVHGFTGTGRDVMKEYKQSKVQEGFDGGVSGAVELRQEGLGFAGLEVKPSVFAAAAVGTDRLEAAFGGRAVIGRNVDGTPQPIPAANPEAPLTTFVRNPNEFKQGNWAIGASVTQYAIQENRYLKGGEPLTEEAVRRAAIDAVYNVRDNVSLSVGCAVYTNPTQNAFSKRNAGPENNHSCKAGVTFGF